MLKRLVRPCEMAPWGYGLAYREFNMNVAVCYPVPLNLVIRWARNLFFWLACPKPTYKELYEGVSAQLGEAQQARRDAEDRYETLLDLWGRQKALKAKLDESEES